MSSRPKYAVSPVPPKTPRYWEGAPIGSTRLTPATGWTEYACQPAGQVTRSPSARVAAFERSTRETAVPVMTTLARRRPRVARAALQAGPRTCVDGERQRLAQDLSLLRLRKRSLAKREVSLLERPAGQLRDHNLAIGFHGLRPPRSGRFYPSLTASPLRTQAHTSRQREERAWRRPGTLATRNRRTTAGAGRFRLKGCGSSISPGSSPARRPRGFWRTSEPR